MRTTDFFKKELTNYMLENKGIYGLFGCPEFGKTTLMMNLINTIVENRYNKVLVYSLDRDRERWLSQMQQLHLNTNGLVVLDEPLDAANVIGKAIQSERPDFVCVNRITLMGPDQCENINTLFEYSERFNVPVLFSAPLSRASGDYDPFERRPEVYDLMMMFQSGVTVGDAREAINKMKLILFLHRHHDCYRGIGEARRYNLSECAEVIVKQRSSYDFPISSCFFPEVSA